MTSETKCEWLGARRSIDFYFLREYGVTRFILHTWVHICDILFSFIIMITVLASRALWLYDLHCTVVCMYIHTYTHTYKHPALREMRQDEENTKRRYYHHHYLWELLANGVIRGSY